MLPNSSWTPCFLRVSPVYPGQQITQLRRRYCHYSALNCWPDEATALKPFCEQACSLAIMPDDLQQISALSPEAKQVAPQGIMFEDLLHPQRQRWKATSHIGVACRQPHTHAFRRDHRSISRPCKIRIRTLTSTVQSTITRRPFAPTISIRPPADTAWLVAGTSECDRAGAGCSASTSRTL